MPRTTVAGMLAAIVGRNRDSYYDAFQPENSSIAIVPATDLRTISMPISELSTAPKDLGEFGAEADVKTGITTVSRDSMSDRQRNPYEMLRDVEYRIYVHTEDNDLYTDLRSSIKEGTAHYTPTLGLSECLASIAPVRVDDSPRIEWEPTPTDETTVDTAIPDSESEIVPQPGRTVYHERSPGYMEAVEGGGRRTTGFIVHSYRRDGGPVTVSEDVDRYAVGEDTVVFS